MAPIQKRLPGIKNPKTDPWNLLLPKGWKPRSYNPPEISPDPWKQMNFDFETEPPPKTWRDIIPPAGRDPSGITHNRPPDPTDIIRRGEAGVSTTNPVRTVQGEVVPPRSLGGAVEEAGSVVGKASRFGKYGAMLGKVGKFAGPLAGALTAKQVYDDIGGQDYYNPQETGGALYDKIFNGPIVDVPKLLTGRSSYESQRGGGSNRPPSSDYADVDPKDFSMLPPLDDSVGPTIANANRIKPATLGLRPRSKGVIGGMRKRGIPNINSMTGLTSDYLDNLDSAGIDVPKTTLDSRNVDLGTNMEPLSPIGNTGDKTPKERTAMQRYMDLLNQFPDEKASKWLKLMGALAGGSQAYFGNPAEGVKTARDIVEHPNDSAVADWKLQLDQLEPLARMESQQYIKNQDVQYKQGRDKMIAFTKNESNRIADLSRQGKHDEAMARIDALESRNEVLGRKLIDGGDGFMHWIDANTLDDTATSIPSLAYKKYQATKSYQDRQAASGEVRAEAATISANAAATKAGKTGTSGGGSPLTQANQRAALEKKATDYVDSQMYAESGAPDGKSFFKSLYSDPKRRAEYERRIQERIDQLMQGGIK